MPRRLTGFILLFASSTALAHPGHDASGLVAGLSHPLFGYDHLLAMVAIGLWAAQRGGRNLLLLPATFMMLLATGALLGMNGPALPQIETGSAASVLALGLITALSLRLPTHISVVIAALFGLLHGYAHGTELPAAASPLSYAAGFLAATAALHLCGIAAGSLVRQRHALIGTALSIAIAGCGVYLLAGG